VYDEDTRRQIDRMLTDRAVDYIAKNGKGDNPFFLYVPFAFAHHPALAHPDFKGKSPASEFGDSLLEHDYNVGRILDADGQPLENLWVEDRVHPNHAGYLIRAKLTKPLLGSPR